MRNGVMPIRRHVPFPVTNISASVGDNTVTISFTNPIGQFIGVRLVYKTGSYPADITDGTIVSPYTSGTPITGLTGNTQYYFRLFPFNMFWLFNTSVTQQISATPTAAAVLSKYGAASPMSPARFQYAAGSVGTATQTDGLWALFLGGVTSSGSANINNTVDIYNPSLVRSATTAYNPIHQQVARRYLNMLVFSGGWNSSGANLGDTMCFTDTLTKYAMTGLSQNRHLCGSTSTGQYCLIAGGRVSSAVTTVDVYNAARTHSLPGQALSAAREKPAGAQIGDYGIVAGGNRGTSGAPTSSAAVEAYNLTLGRSLPAMLSGARYSCWGVTVGNYAIIGPGNTNTVDAYDALLTKHPIAAVVISGYTYVNGTAVSIKGKFGLFFGNGAFNNNVVNAYDANLTRSTPTGFTRNRTFAGAAEVGIYGLLGGGYDGNQAYGDVDVWQVT